MRMIVVGDIAHVIVHEDLPELVSGDFTETRVHVGQMVDGRLRAVEAPHHHRHVANIALGDPANIVFVVPRGDAGCATEITPVDLGEGGLGSCHGDPRIDRRGY